MAFELLSYLRSRKGSTEKGILEAEYSPKTHQYRNPSTGKFVSEEERTRLFTKIAVMELTTRGYVFSEEVF